jgi:hypothetical protein
MYIDGLGSSVQTILTTWKLNKFTRPEVDLYPVKLASGFRGHRFILSAIEKPPLVFRRYIQLQHIFFKLIFFFLWTCVFMSMICKFLKRTHILLSINKVLTQEHSILWDGIEIRLLQLIAGVLNFTLEIHDATLSKSR